jgi:hypothetical protein
MDKMGIVSAQSEHLFSSVEAVHGEHVARKTQNESQMSSFDQLQYFLNFT